MQVSAKLLVAGIVTFLNTSSCTAGFLKSMSVSTDLLESSLLTELAGSVHMKGDRIRFFENAIEPIYNAVPKENSGALSHKVVRYVLHRFFSQYRHWYVRGLEPDGDVRSASSVGLKEVHEWPPSYLQNFLEEVLGAKGVSLRELAVLAATIEDLINKEVVTWLEGVYSVLNISKSTVLEKEQLLALLETYLKIFSSPSNGNATVEAIDKARNWSETQKWLRDLLMELFSQTQRFNANDAVTAAAAAGERYGHFYDKECRSLKTALVGIESKKPGRVRLADFYKQALKGTWDFNEKIEYLRVLGALDESDPSTPLVIMPNYIASRPNCLTTSSFYAVCCRNECEDIMQSLEAELHGPTAHPRDVLRLVGTRPAEMVPSLRNLSDTLVERLEKVAMAHDGQVPLHGRLFAQWLHHAFPRHCPFPHESGVASPMTPDDWMDGNIVSKASDEEMLLRVKSDTCRLLPHGMLCRTSESPEMLASLPISSDTYGLDEDLPWKDVEELLVPRPSVPILAAPGKKSEKLPPFYRLALFVAFLPAAFGMAWVSMLMGLRG